MNEEEASWWEEVGRRNEGGRRSSGMGRKVKGIAGRIVKGRRKANDDMEGGVEWSVQRRSRGGNVKFGGGEGKGGGGG